MIRHHIAAGAIDRIVEVAQRPPHAMDGNPFKPRGLWYEIGGAWREWCAAERCDWVSGRRLYRLELNGENVLRLGTDAEIDAFTERYMVALYPGQRVHGLDSTFGAIDWRPVAAVWDGIEIMPYCYESRFRHMWYYGWDCASGCLWRPLGAGLVLEEEALP